MSTNCISQLPTSPSSSTRRARPATYVRGEVLHASLALLIAMAHVTASWGQVANQHQKEGVSLPPDCVAMLTVAARALSSTEVTYSSTFA